MTQPTEKDIEKIKQLRGYYTREYDLKTDIEFMQWISEAMKIIRAADYQRVKATFEKRSDTLDAALPCGCKQSDLVMEVETGKFHCTRHGNYLSDFGADWK